MGMKRNLKMSKDYLKARIKKVVGKSENVKIANERNRICLSCEKHNKEKNTCGICGCPIRNLIYGEDKHCKLNKWNHDKEL